MPGPSNANSKKKRKSQGKNGSRHQRKSSGASSTIRGSLSLKEVEVALEDTAKDEQREKDNTGWRKSVGSDSDTSGLRTPTSPDLAHPNRISGCTGNEEPNNVELSCSNTVEAQNEALREGPHTDLTSDDIPPERTDLPACSEDILEEPTYIPGKHDHILLGEPCIHDSGNGPRVRDTREFLKSPFFAQSPALDDPLRAEFAQEEVLQMLKTVLPEEMALILWYNKSRPTSRICPACHRLYHVGDVLPDSIDTTTETNVPPPPPQPSIGMHPQLRREQDISGFCSSICFILASVAQCDPISIKSAWGHTADEIDDKSWSQISKSSHIGSAGFQELTMVLRMTRLHDLGLGQLCFPDLDWEGPPEEELPRDGS